MIRDTFFVLVFYSIILCIRISCLSFKKGNDYNNDNNIFNNSSTFREVNVYHWTKKKRYVVIKYVYIMWILKFYNNTLFLLRSFNKNGVPHRCDAPNPNYRLIATKFWHTGCWIWPCIGSGFCTPIWCLLGGWCPALPMIVALDSWCAPFLFLESINCWGLVINRNKTLCTKINHPQQEQCLGSINDEIRHGTDRLRRWFDSEITIS